MPPSETEESTREECVWGETVDRAVAGDSLAYGRLTRLVTGYLARWRAGDFRAEWEDIVQEVLVSAVAAWREGRIGSDAEFQAFVRRATRNRFIDRLRARQRRPNVSYDENESDPTGVSAVSAVWPPEKPLADRAASMRISIRQAVGRLEARERAAVIEVHLRGRTYDEAASETGIPLGSLKRALRSGLARLRETLEEATDD